MADIEFESIKPINKDSHVLSEFKVRSVVFVFDNPDIEPIACTLDYLYALTHQNHSVTKVTNDGDDKTVIEETYKQDYTFYRTIKNMIFKYGLKAEYYKNIHGKWIDMISVRMNMSVKNALSSPYTNGVLTNNIPINDNIMETSVYTLLCDNAEFSNTTGPMSICRIKDINLIPEVNKYIVKDKNSNSGNVYRVGRGDGTYELPKVDYYIFEDANVFNKDTVHMNDPKYGKFTYTLANHFDNTIGSGDFNNNSHHKTDDLLLTFTGADGVTPFTDLDNMFVICNGVFVDYERHPVNPNQIYLNDVIKFATIQQTGLKNGVNPDMYVVKSETSRGKSILDYDIPREKCGLSYTFDIKIYKWENVKVSHFESPIHNNSMNKVEPTENDRSFWLKNSLMFGKYVDKNKCILLCNNEIVPKSDWSVNPDNNHIIDLKMVSIEFDIIYSEVYKELQQYLVQIIGHNIKYAPNIDDYISKSSITSIEQLEAAMQEYEDAINDWKAAGFENNIHFSKSAMAIVEQQFSNRNYYLVRFDTIDERNYEINVSENTIDLEFNTPYRNKFRNKNWSPDDILVLNGLYYRMINEYEDVFTMAPTWYLHDINGVFDNVYGYKLQISTHKLLTDKYLKLNKVEIIEGPIEGVEYYSFNSLKNNYELIGTLDKFDVTYTLVTDTMKEKGVNPNVIYLTKDSDGNYKRVSLDFESFEDGISYYICNFDKNYYLKK